MSLENVQSKMRKHESVWQSTTSHFCFFAYFEYKCIYLENERSQSSIQGFFKGLG
jgi:hypothetical protein